jgi:DNA-binding NtrC family response regulator
VETLEKSALRILVADDDALICRVVERALRSRGYVVTATATWEDTIAVYENAVFGLVILDAHMPGPSLENVLGQMRQTRPLPRTIIMSGDLERPTWLPEEQSFISKPFDLSTFLQTVARLLESGDFEVSHENVTP